VVFVSCDVWSVSLALSTHYGDQTRKSTGALDAAIGQSINRTFTYIGALVSIYIYHRVTITSIYLL
jgi:hypothetical protein